MTQYFQGKTALVTGASRGIGKAIARVLGNNGAYVIGTSTTENGCQEITKAFTSAGIAGQGIVLEVKDRASRDQFVERLQESGKIPLILVNNAGITRDNLLLRMKDEEWSDVIATNLDSVYHLCRICIRGMIKARFGRIINISSVVAFSGNPGQTNYSASKAGIIGFTRSLAREIGSRNITVNAVAPGYIDTEMTAALSEEQQNSLHERIALGRMGNVEEVASVVKFLASDDASYITGETINVNGGMYMA